jgi:hypothetical protein
MLNKAFFSVTYGVSKLSCRDGGATAQTATHLPRQENRYFFARPFLSHLRNSFVISPASPSHQLALPGDTNRQACISREPLHFSGPGCLFIPSTVAP